MIRNKIFKWLTCGALAAGLMGTAAGAFVDTNGHWAEQAISKWSEEYSIIQGYEDGTFRPDNSITRGAFAGIMDRFLQFREVASAGTFSDLTGNYWEDAILKLNAAGIYLGNNGKALPTDTITRQQAVTMIARAFHIEAETTSLHYTDADRIAEYARPAVAEMTARGFVNDSMDGSFRPADPITRAEIVNILSNMIQVLLKDGGSHAGDVFGSLMVSSPEGAVISDGLIMGDLILAPGVRGDVILERVDIEGEIRNFSEVEPTIVKNLPEKDEKPDEPAKLPEEVYTPGKTTGKHFQYDGKPIPVYKGVEKSRLYEGDFYWEGDRLEYIGSEFDTRFGIDVSAYQNRASEDETIDWGGRGG